MRNLRNLACFSALFSLLTAGVAQAATSPLDYNARTTSPVIGSLLVVTEVDAKRGPLSGKPTLIKRPARTKTAMMTSYQMCIINLMIRFKARGGRLQQFPLDMAELMCMPLD